MIKFMGINFVSVGLILVFIFPVLVGAYNPFTREKIDHSLQALINNIFLMVHLVAAIYLINQIFFEQDLGVYEAVYQRIPQAVKGLAQERVFLTYLIGVPVLMVLLSLVTLPFRVLLYRRKVVPLSEKIYSKVSGFPAVIKSILGAFFSIPRSVVAILVAGVLLHFYTYYFYAPGLSKQLKGSEVYGVLYENALRPVMDSNVAKRIPVLVNDSFEGVMEQVASQEGKDGVDNLREELRKRLNVKVIKYFNGVTLEEAIQSDSEIDQKAREIVMGEKEDTKKAYRLYQWVSKNIEYDYRKAERVSKDTDGITSGAKIAFESGKGICFDYSSLYVAMCRAVQLKVRLVTGSAFSGTAWGDHAWNQVYSAEENRWIQVDTTFGSSGVNFFDSPSFDEDHKNGIIQGEW